MASKFVSSNCQNCKIGCCLKRPCVICNETLCFECAAGFDPLLTYEKFANYDYYVCRRKCMEKYTENAPSEQTKDKAAEEYTKSPGAEGSLDDTKKAGTSKSPPKYVGKTCPTCFKLQPDFRVCQKCGFAFEYYCEDDCWKIPDEVDALGKKKWRKWLCYWCETGCRNSVSFQSNQKRFIRLNLDLMAGLDELIASETTVIGEDLVSWITIKPPKLKLSDIDASSISPTFDVVTPAEVAEAEGEEELRNFLRQVRASQQESLINVGNDFIFLGTFNANKAPEVERQFGIDGEPCSKSLTPEQQALLEDALIDIPFEISENKSLEQKLENLRRDIEDIEVITRAKVAKNRASGGRFSAAGSSSETTIKQRIEAARRAVEAFHANTQQMKETAMEDIRLVLEGKVKCLLKIWEDMGKKK